MAPAPNIDLRMVGHDCEAIRVKVYDSRRKQRWVDPLLTPPRSPTIPEPIIDDLLELWTGAGLDELPDDQDISINSALNELGFTDDGSSLLASYSIPFPQSGSVSEDDDELLDRLFEFVDSPPPTNPPSPRDLFDLESASSSNCSVKTEPLYDEGFIGEDLINEQPDIFSTSIRIAGPTSNIFNESDTKIKHDCMWAGHDSRYDDFIDDFIVDHHPVIKSEIKEELEDVEEEEMAWEESYTWSEESSPSTVTEEEPSCPSSQSSSDEQLDWREPFNELEFIRNAAYNDHSYASPPGHEDDLSDFKDDSYNPSHTIQGIVIKDEEDWEPSHGPRKTKILVPLKELMETLHQKRFLVAPLGPGKKVIRLTGSETVKGVLGVHGSNHLSFSTTSLSKHCVPSNLTSQHRRKQKAKPKDLSSSPSPPSNSVQPTISRPKKTKTHNNMERMRRIDLRNSFDSLKKLVPPLSKSTKCSKVEILRRAEEYIKALKSVEKRLVREEATTRSRNDALKVKLLHAQQCA